MYGIILFLIACLFLFLNKMEPWKKLYFSFLTVLLLISQVDGNLALAYKNFSFLKSPSIRKIEVAEGLNIENRTTLDKERIAKFQQEQAEKMKRKKREEIAAKKEQEKIAAKQEQEKIATKKKQEKIKAEKKKQQEERKNKKENERAPTSELTKKWRLIENWWKEQSK